ncbi:MAG: hypothetical protein LDLANPLL_00379 [Turneriella sp.]|nr:hypothetical protein [Turneriella sp.]
MTILVPSRAKPLPLPTLRLRSVRVWRVARRLKLFCFFLLFGLLSAAEASDKFTQAYQDADEAVERNRVTNSFFAIGPTVGLPAGLNAHASLYLWRFVVHGVGMFYSPDFMGAQGGVGFSFLNGARIRHSVSLVGGFMRRNPILSTSSMATIQDATYAGVAYEFFADGFFVQVGLAHGLSGNMANPILIFQTGYLFSFMN